MSVAIVGAGISGLAAGVFIDDAVIFEANTTAGGWVQQVPQASRVVHDQAANGWLSNEPAVPMLIEKLGLENELLQASPARSVRWVYHRDQMCLVPSSPWQLLRSPLLSVAAKLRLLLSPLLMGRESNANESVAEFAQRHLGAGVLDTLLAPMVAGIFGARPEELSVDAAFPLLRELEQHGSLFAGIKARQRERRDRGEAAPVLTSLRGGLGELTRAMVEHVGDRLRSNTPIHSLEAHADGWVIHSGSQQWFFEKVLLACPAPAQARLLPVSPEMEALRAALAGVKYTDVVVAISEFQRGCFEREPEGFGVLLSRAEQCSGPLGLLFSSNIFPSHVPDDRNLTRCILGGSPNPNVLQLSDAELRSAVEELHQKLFGARQQQAMRISLIRHRQAIPCYGLQHPRLHQLVMEHHRAVPTLRLLGNHLFGVGIKDCVRNASQQAQAIEERS